MTFSQRMGLKPATKVVQKDEMDVDLTNSLWTAITEVYWPPSQPESGLYSDLLLEQLFRGNRVPMLKCLWMNHFKEPVDQISGHFSTDIQHTKERFFKAKWMDKYDFIEAVLECGPEELGPRFMKLCNTFLERENSAYRFVNGQITEITSDVEIASVEEAIESAPPFSGARKHLKTALSRMNDRKKPDYRNSIKESISAVESVVKTIFGNKKATIGDALNALEKKGKLHPALKAGFSSLHGWTSDAEGIRHALMEKESLQKPDALYMLVTCSAFINYLIAHAKK